MNSIYLLIIWSAFLNSGAHNLDGAITYIPFATASHCEYALKTVRDTAKNINGVCVPQGSVPAATDPRKSGPVRKVRPNLTGWAD